MFCILSSDCWNLDAISACNLSSIYLFSSWPRLLLFLVPVSMAVSSVRRYVDLCCLLNRERKGVAIASLLVKEEIVKGGRAIEAEYQLVIINT